MSLTCGRLCVDRGSSRRAARAGRSTGRRPDFPLRSPPSAGSALKDEVQVILGVSHLHPGKLPGRANDHDEPEEPAGVS